MTRIEMEAAIRRLRRRRPGRGSSAMSKQCPPGYHQKDGRCVKMSGSERSRERRLKKKWRRSGAGKMSRRRQIRWSHMFDSIAEARELLDLD